MIVAQTPITPEQLLAMPDSSGLEIVAGKLVEKPVGVESNQIGVLLVALLLHHCRQHQLGRVLGFEGAFQCFPHDPTMVRKPDVAFVSYAKIPAGQFIGSYVKVAPDLAIEVLSPNDLYKEINDRVADYLTAGASQVWIVNGFRQQVEIHTSLGTKVLSKVDELAAEDILPGFRCQVSELFAGIPTQE